MRNLAALLLTLATCAQAGQITFPAHVGYAPARLQLPTQTTRLKVCPLPTSLWACAAGQGWVDPATTSPIPGYWLRHVVYRTDGAAVLFFCPDGGLCEGDE